MEQHAGSEIAHALHVIEVRPENGECSQNILQRLIQFHALAEQPELRVRPMQVLLNRLNVLFESLIVLNVLLRKPDSLEEFGVELEADFLFVADQSIPHITPHFDRNPLLQSLFKRFVIGQVALGADERQEHVNPLLYLCLVI